MSTDFKAGQLRAALQTKDELLRGLIDMAPREVRGDALRLAEQLEETLRYIIENSPSSIDLDIARATKTIKAVMIWLKKKGRPATQNEIIEGVYSAGFRRQENGSPEQHKGNISKSFKMHLEGAAADGKTIKTVGALIGLAVWGNDRFLIDGNTEESLPPKDH